MFFLLLLLPPPPNSFHKLVRTVFKEIRLCYLVLKFLSISEVFSRSKEEFIQHTKFYQVSEPSQKLFALAWNSSFTSQLKYSFLKKDFINLWLYMFILLTQVSPTPCSGLYFFSEWICKRRQFCYHYSVTI